MQLTSQWNDELPENKSQKEHNANPYSYVKCINPVSKYQLAHSTVNNSPSIAATFFY